MPNIIEEAQRCGYVIAPNERSLALHMFFLWCETTGRPYICIVKSKKEAIVRLDLVTTGKNGFIKKFFPQNAVAELQVIFKRYPTHTYGKCGYGADWFTHTNIPWGAAKGVAEELLALYYRSAIPL